VINLHNKYKDIIFKIAESKKETDKYQNKVITGGLAGLLAGKAGQKLAVKKLMSDHAKGKLDTHDFNDVKNTIEGLAKKHKIKVDTKFTNSPLSSNAVPKFGDRYLKKMYDIIGSDLTDVNPMIRKMYGNIDDIQRRIKENATRINIPKTNKAIALHELGHAKSFNNSGAIKTLAYSPVGQSAIGLATLPLYSKKVRDKIKRLDGDHKVVDKVVDTVDKVPELMTVAPFVPQLFEEAKASGFAVKELAKSHGLKKGLKQAKPLLPAFGTYAGRAAALSLLAAGAYRAVNAKHRVKNKDTEKTASELLDEMYKEATK